MMRLYNTYTYFVQKDYDMFTGRVSKLCQPIEETVAFLSKPFSKEISMKVLFTVAETVTSLKKLKI
jgi:hypothetical protein